MRDRSLIYLGLLVFLAVVTFPITYNLASGKTASMPELRLPEQSTQCVEPTAFMKSSHMQLLVDWREKMVRENIRTYTATDGRTYTVSLTNTCLTECHASKADFCDRCHNYSGVQNPYCWDCHVDPEHTERSAQ
jgi:hypothetical protein